MLSSRLFRTISFQLTAFYCLIFAVGFLSLLLITYLTTTTALRSQIQTEVLDQLRTMTTEAETDGITTVVEDIIEKTAVANNSAGFYFLSGPDGQKLAGNLDAVVPTAGWRETGLNFPTAAKVDTTLDVDHQIWGQGNRLSDGSFLFVGKDARHVLAAQEEIVSSAAWSSGIAFLLAVLASIYASRGFLRRIDNINQTSLTIMDGNLSQRIPVSGTADELDKLSANLNRLFDSNQSLMESLKQVSSNIAHDLRTPLSRMQQGLETARSCAKTKQELTTAIDAAVVESDQLLATFAALLRIAQIESGTRKAGFKQVDLSKMFDRIATAYQAVAEDQHKVLVTSWPSVCMVTGDEELLLQMTVNLLENAIRHTPAGTQIGLALAQTKSDASIIVSDSGPGIPVDQCQKVLEHFYRLDASRTTEGNGLGLALVSAIAKLHGSQVVLEDNQPGLRARVSLLRR